LNPPSDERIKPYLPWVKDQELVVGTFGVPSMKKGLNLFFDACRQLRASGVALRVVLAGFGWDEFLKRAPQLIENLNVDIYSDVNDEELLMLMDEVHVGVQLRLQNLGESSGVVASLVKKKIPLIVSATGAFYDGGFKSEVQHLIR
jgi:glycosyltransferase involved in cell wall biosynthesis